MFTTYPSYNWRRAMQLTKPRLEGEDVYGLQIACNFLLRQENRVDNDGILGKATAEAIIAVQHELELAPDGVAGSLTQRGLALRIGHEAKQKYPLAKGLPGGQIEHESSYCLGAFSPPRPDGSYDAGVVQRNTAYTEPRNGFDPVQSIYALCKQVRQKYDLYKEVDSERRRWELAAGSWNAPAFADGLAGVGGVVPGTQSRAIFEAYMDSVCAYLRID